MASDSFEVAIVGGGIIGVITALGLQRRGIKTTIYERAPTWHEVSAGFAFTRAARECMERIEPRLVEVLGSISQKTDANTCNSYWDGYHPRTLEEAEDETKSLLFRTPTHNMDYWGCVRSQFLHGMAALLPEGSVQFKKQLASYEDDDKNGKVVLNFDDGSTEKADVLVGCDGIHSATRRAMFGADHPASEPVYAHQVAYRTMVPIDVGVEALGSKTAVSACIQTGPDAAILSYPVMSGTVLNIAVFAHDFEPDSFPDPTRMVAPAKREELQRLLEGFSPHLANIWKVYPEDSLVKWGLFDTASNPPPTYAQGRVCIMGDAAHGSTPFLGAGACTGVEDAPVLCTMLEFVQQNKRTPQSASGDNLLRESLQAYSRARMERGQWVARNSREIGDCYMWRFGPTGRDTKKFNEKLSKAYHYITNYDVLGAVEIPAC